MDEARKDTPINYSVVNKVIEESGLPNVGKASIRELLKIVNQIEKESRKKFIRMEMGIPGLPASKIGIDAEIEALKAGVASSYTNIEGIPSLKQEASRFVKLFLDLDVSPEGCIPTVGSAMGSFASFLTLGRMYDWKNTTLFLDPGFPVHKQQHIVLGQKFESFDVYNYRGDKLYDRLESFLKKGNFHSLLYSNPNNPTWICFTDKELQIIAELAGKFNVVVIEDLAYIGMDFRKDYSQPGRPPFQPTIGKYLKKYILLISTSKAFSYAGQRLGLMIVSDDLFNTNYKDLRKYFSSEIFGKAMIFGSVYSLSAGTAHSPQYAIAAILKEVNNGNYNFRDDVIEYAKRAKIMKKLFIDNGFKIVYDMDENEPIADGFYFTFSYPGFTGDDLVKELLYYGISAISLSITGSERLEGVRACVSKVSRDQFNDLEFRLMKFYKDHRPE